MAPSAVLDVEATLVDKHTTKITWKKPESGGDVRGYKVICGDETYKVDPDVSHQVLRHNILPIINNYNVRLKYLFYDENK